MTFKIGDVVIMTADSGKGKIFAPIYNGEYKGIIKFVGDTIEIEANDDTFYFERNGYNSHYPGMSIRLAKEEITDHCGKCNKRVTGESRHVCDTPSQWIEGQVPDGETGLFLVWDKANGGHPDAFYVENKKGDWHKDYIYYIKLNVLPPPPPVKEVEAYGFLEATKLFIDAHNKRSLLTDENNRKESLAMALSCGIPHLIHFYSKPATAEVKEKYLALETIKKCVWYSDPNLSLDQFINWYQKEYEKLLFTPAALDELGVK